MLNDNLAQRRNKKNVFLWTHSKKSQAISIHFLQKHNLFLSAIINLPELMRLMRLRPI